MWMRCLPCGARARGGGGGDVAGLPARPLARSPARAHLCILARLLLLVHPDGCALASPIAAGTPGGNCIGTAASAPKTEGGAKQPPSDAGTTATTSEWQVAAKHFGVGGFAVGVARSAWKGPYKSTCGTADCHEAHLPPSMRDPQSFCL